MIDKELYLRELEELVNVDCGSQNVAGINIIADKLTGWYQEIGWHVTRHDLGEMTAARTADRREQRLMELLQRDRISVMAISSPVRAAKT